METQEACQKRKEAWWKELEPKIRSWGKPLEELGQVICRRQSDLYREECEAEELRMEEERHRKTHSRPHPLDPSLLTPAPDFAKIVSNPDLVAILENRWLEAQRCFHAGAHLAAVVMSGSILEGALFAFTEARLQDAHRSPKCLKNKKDSTPRDLAEWSLFDLIEVAHDRGWLQETKRFSHPLRESRNMVHPRQQLKLAENPDAGASEICWTVVKAAVTRLIEIAPAPPAP
jgi:hypothetical protein